LLVPLERLEEPSGGAAQVGAALELGLDPPLADDPRVVGPLVVAAEPIQHLVRVGDDPVGAARELVGDGEQQHDEHVLVVGIGAQDVPADAVGFLRLVEQPVALRLGHGPGDGGLAERLQLEHDGPLLQLVARNTWNSRRSGSYASSTTRSFKGMMALSVMAMPSGHTRVQHLVMLHSPTPWAVRASPTRSSTSSGWISSAATYMRKRGPANRSCSSCSRRTWQTSWQRKHSMHLRNSCTRSMSIWAMRQVPSGASGCLGLNSLIPFFTRKFQETSVTRSRTSGNAFIGRRATGRESGRSDRRDLV